MLRYESTPSDAGAHDHPGVVKASVDSHDDATDSGVPTLISPDIALSRNLAHFSDDLVRVPGTTFGIGADAVIGLIPGVGDLVGTGISTVIMVDAIRQRVPVTVLVIMGGNTLIDTSLGFVPGIGDVADVVHRANRKNFRLLERCLAEEKRVATDVRGYLLRAGAVVVGSVVASLGMVVLLIWGVVKAIIAAFR